LRNTTRCRVLAIAIVLDVLALGWVCFFHLPPRSINRANFERIQVGMTETQVERILGGPAGDYTFDRILGTPARGRIQSWTSDLARLVVCFDDQRQVQRKEFFSVRRDDWKTSANGPVIGHALHFSNADGQVTSRMFIDSRPTPPAPETFFEKFRRWLGL